MLTVTYKTLHGLAPTHIEDLLQSYLAAEDLRASKKKKNLLAVRAFNINSYGRRAFSVATSLLWNIELNNNTAHRTHNDTVSWFIPPQSDSQSLTKLDETTSKENSRSQCFYDSSSSSLLSTHVLITLFGSPSPNLVVLLNVTKL